MKTVVVFMLSVLLTITLLMYCAAPQKIYTEKGLVDGEPGMNRFESGEAGTTTPLEREYDIAPPVIPHDIADFEITRTSNDCLECHLDGLEMDDGHVAKKLPESHYRNDYTSESSGDQLTGIRYNCLQCHVAQAVLEQTGEL